MSALAAGGGPPAYLEQVVALVGAAAVIGYLCARLRVVPIVGFLLAGVLIGPSVLGVVREREVVDAAAEVGVILLLFTIGIEFSIGRLMAIRRTVLLGGSLQVGGAVAVVTGVCLLADVDLRSAVFTGLVVSLSSTAIVLKLLADRGATGTPTGQAALGLLIFQDLAVVAMVLLVPVLGTGGGGGGLELARRGRGRRDAGGRAQGHAAGARGGGARLLPRGVPAVGDRAVPGHRLPDRAGGGVGVAGRVPRRPGRQRVAALGARPRRGAAAADHLLGGVLPVGRDPARRGLPRRGAAAGARRRRGGGRGQGADDPGRGPGGRAAAGHGRVGGAAAGAGRGVRLRARARGRRRGALTGGPRRAGGAGVPRGDRGAAGRDARPGRARTGVRGADGGPATGGRPARPAGAGHRARPRVGLGPVGPRRGDRPGRLRRAGRRHDPQPRRGRRGRAARPRGGARRLHQAARPGRGGGCGGPRRGHRRRRARAGGAHRGVVSTYAPQAEVVVLAPHPDDVPALHEAGVGTVVLADRATSDRLVRAVRDRLRPGAPSGRTVVDVNAVVAFRADLESACAHAGVSRPVVPNAPGCTECLRDGETGWVHLRVCTSCGHVGCCDSSPGRHAAAHARADDHPVMCSAEPGEHWGWCYLDEVTLSAAR